VDIRPKFNVLSLCAGAGGLELGLRLAVPNAATVCYVEREAFACEVLASRMQDEVLDQAPIWTDLTTFDGRPWRGVVDCVVGGYPCQPFSAMGKLMSTEDPRHLWPNVARIVRECEPEWVFFENVANHLNEGFDIVSGDLREMGFKVEAGLFGSDEVGDTHHRRRLFILGHAESRRGRRGREREEEHEVQAGRPDSGMGHQERDSRGVRLQDLSYDGLPLFPPSPDSIDRWREVLEQRPEYVPGYKPELRRVVDELASVVDGLEEETRQDQVRLLGNGVVPACAGYAFGVLKDRLERGA
jgi:DNA (cytosine-5)-methyltransferase 1